ncbi:MAG: exosortase C-terminal domain/associated protein EpsI, partial [Pyrinomonadaceae bacterium]
MNVQAKHFWALVVVLVLGGVVINFMEAAGETHVARTALHEFPARVGDWQQLRPDARFDAATEAVLRADEYIQRDYHSPDGRTASLYVGYYATQRTGATYHSPLNCLPGSGWTMSDAGVVRVNPTGGAQAFDANRFVIQNGGERQLLVYWYQGRGRAVASEYWDKVYTVLDSTRRRRSDGAMVRVLVPVRGADDEAALQIATAFA